MKKRYIVRTLFSFLLLCLSIPFIVNTAIQTGVPEVMWAMFAPVISVIMIFATTCFESKGEEEEFAFRIAFSVLTTFLIFICIDIAAVGLSNATVAGLSILLPGLTATAVFRDE